MQGIYASMLRDSVYFTTLKSLDYNVVMTFRFNNNNNNNNNLSPYVTSHLGQLSLAIPLWAIGAVSNSQRAGLRAVTPCGWGVKAVMVRVWVSGKTV